MPDIPPVSAPVAETEYATFLALDWGDQEHAWGLQIEGLLPPTAQVQVDARDDNNSSSG